jgi:hypothetical protein
MDRLCSAAVLLSRFSLGAVELPAHRSRLPVWEARAWNVW